MTILFNDTLGIAEAILKRHPKMLLGDDIVLVRDLRGRLRPLYVKHPENFNQDAQKAFHKDLADSLGKYGFPERHAALYANTVQLDQEISSLAVPLTEIPCNGQKNRVLLLDRQIIGHDWLQKKLPRETTNPRAVFFSIKGGVGRSTALLNWACHLAGEGRKVLVLDLDLESPGLSTTLLPATQDPNRETRPDYGIVDWFVEEAVGQRELVDSDMVGVARHFTRGLPGDIYVAPCFGRKTAPYLPKLARCYAEYDGKSFRPWAERLGELVSFLETKYRPDITLIDSRAGLNDIGAALVCRLDAAVFLFALNTRQTWDAYADIFTAWKRHPELDELRWALKMVYSMVPETDREKCRQTFITNSDKLFRDHLYEELPPDSVDGFNFNDSDSDAPHYPLLINWVRGLQEYQPGDIEDVDFGLFNEAYIGFFAAASEHVGLQEREE